MKKAIFSGAVSVCLENKPLSWLSPHCKNQNVFCNNPRNLWPCSFLDKEGRFGKTISKYMGCCNDEKFITARQAIQGLETIVKATGKFDRDIKQGISNLQVSQYKENQQKLLKKDISNVLKTINR